MEGKYLGYKLKQITGPVEELFPTYTYEDYAICEGWDARSVFEDYLNKIYGKEFDLDSDSSDFTANNLIIESSNFYYIDRKEHAIIRFSELPNITTEPGKLLVLRF